MSRPIARRARDIGGDRRLCAWRPGFTMTEMLIALFLATVGMVTVFGMQVAANLVQRQARDINASRMLGESFITKLRGETIDWTSTTLSDDCTQTEMPLCHWALFGAKGGDGVWVPAPSVDTSFSPRYNALGIPDDESDPSVSTVPASVRNHNQRYCIHYNLSANVGEVRAPGELMRVQVRVFWPVTNDAFANPPLGVSDCGYSNPQNLVDAAARGQFRFTQLNTVLYRHEESS